MRERVLIATVSAVLVWTAAARAFDPAEHLPDDTLLYVDFSLGDDFLEKVRGTALWKIWENPEVQRFLEKPLERLTRDFESWVEYVERTQGLELGPIFDLLPPRRFTFALSSFDFVEEVKGSVVFFVDFGPQKDGARKAVDFFLEAARKAASREDVKLSISERDASGVKVHSISEEGEDYSFELAFKDGVLLFAADPHGGAKAPVLDDFLDPEKQLADDADFQLVRKKLGEGVPFVYLRMGTFKDQVVKSLKRKEGDRKDEPDVEAVLKAMGLSGLGGMGYVQKIDGPDLVDRFCVRIPEPREGLMAAWMAAPLPKERMARFAPGNAQTYAEMSLDLDKLVESAKSILSLFAEDDKEKELFKGLEVVKEKTGFSLSEILGCFSGRLATYGAMPASMISVGQEGLILHLKDPEKLQEILGKVRELPEVKETLSIREETYKDIPLVSITIRNLPVPFMPSYAVIEDHLVITESIFSLKMLVDSLAAEGGSLADNEKFKAVVGHAFRKGTVGGAYEDMPVFMERFYTLFSSVFMMAFASSPPVKEAFDEFGVDWNLLPSARAIARPLTVGWENLRVDADGIEYEGRSAFGAGVLGMYKVLVGAILPFATVNALQEQLLDQQQEISRKRLAKLHDAVKLYARTVGGGRQPRSLLALLRAELVEEDDLVAPADRKPRKLEDPETGEEIAVSYVLRSRGFSEKNGMVLYERDSWYGGGKRFVVRKDGTVELALSQRVFERMLRGEDTRGSRDRGVAPKF